MITAAIISNTDGSIKCCIWNYEEFTVNKSISAILEGRNPHVQFGERTITIEAEPNTRCSATFPLDNLIVKISKLAWLP